MPQPSYSRPSQASLRASATTYVTRFYTALDLRDYDAAWRRLPAGTKAESGDFGAWKGGYRQTMASDVSDISATVVGEATATVNLTLRATDLDACADEVRQRFAVSWSLTRISGRWAATAIRSQKVSGRTPATKASECDDGVDEPLPALPEAPDSSIGFCEIHACIENFDNGSGSIVRCADGMYSHSGGRQGACSSHGGVAAGSLPSRPRRRPSYGSSEPSSGGTVHVDGYFRKDGTYVRPHTRRAPCSYC